MAGSELSALSRPLLRRAWGDLALSPILHLVLIAALIALLSLAMPPADPGDVPPVSQWLQSHG